MEKELFLKIHDLFKISPFMLNSEIVYSSKTRSVVSLNFREDTFIQIAFIEFQNNYSYNLSLYHENNNKSFIKLTSIIRDVNGHSFYYHDNLYFIENEGISIFNKIDLHHDEDIEKLIYSLKLFNEEFEKLNSLMKELNERIKNSEFESPLIIIYIFSKGFCVFNSFLNGVSVWDLDLYSYENKFLTLEEVLSFSDDEFSNFISFSEKIHSFRKSNPYKTSVENKYPVLNIRTSIFQ